ncbi:hypothetical protein VNO77_03863 [Canavalia gladiata]|uniref:YTH domain-containing family protein n=1 Tax=Canavalia gladiata TaxID=3824 RepID=A0AAN9N157_CANGL
MVSLNMLQKAGPNQHYLDNVCIIFMLIIVSHGLQSYVLLWLGTESPDNEVKNAAHHGRKDGSNMAKVRKREMPCNLHAGYDSTSAKVRGDGFESQAALFCFNFWTPLSINLWAVCDNQKVELIGPWQQEKWNGCFPLKWHVPNNLLRHITLDNNENKLVTNSKDTQENFGTLGSPIIRETGYAAHCLCSSKLLVRSSQSIVNLGQAHFLLFHLGQAQHAS